MFLGKLMKYIQIQTAVYDEGKALEIAESLVKNKLAGCVQVLGPAKSFYLWKGKLIKDDEFLLLIKTRKDLYKQVEETIKKMHTYKVPEIISLGIDEGSKNYLEWLNEILSIKRL